MSHRFTLPAALTLPTAAGGLLLLSALNAAAQPEAAELKPLIPARLISTAPPAPNTDFGPAPAPREPRVIMPQSLTKPVALAHPLNLSGPRLTLSGHHVPLQDQSVQTGPVDAGQTMSVMFVLKPRNQAAMDNRGCLPSQANVRSTTQRRGNTEKPFWSAGLSTISRSRFQHVLAYSTRWPS